MLLSKANKCNELNHCKNDLSGSQTVDHSKHTFNGCLADRCATKLRPEIVCSGRVKIYEDEGSNPYL